MLNGEPAFIWKVEWILREPIRVKRDRASLGKPIVSIEVERRSLVNLYRISMQEGIFTQLARH